MIALTKEIGSSENLYLKTLPLDILFNFSVQEYLQRQESLSRLKRRVQDVGCMPLGKIFKTETMMWSFFEDFLLIKLVLRHGYSSMNDTIDDPAW